MSVDMKAVEAAAREAIDAVEASKDAQRKVEEAQRAADVAQAEAEVAASLSIERIEYLINVPNRPTFRHSYSGKDVSYATEKELLDFANRVREAGGAEALEALLPSRPTNPVSCLIANALNFGCKVDGASIDVINEPGPNGENRWTMEVPEDIAKSVAVQLGLRIYDGRFLILPWIIGNSAKAFDDREGWTTKYIERVPLAPKSKLYDPFDSSFITKKWYDSEY